MNQPYLNIEGEWVRLLTEDDIPDIMTSLELRQQRKDEWLISEDKGHALCSECTDKVYFLFKFCLSLLNYTYKGKTLKEWADSISKPQTNADRIRAMTDEELAGTMLDCFAAFYDVEWSKQDILDWLKQEASE